MKCPSKCDRIFAERVSAATKDNGSGGEGGVVVVVVHVARRPKPTFLLSPHSVSPNLIEIVYTHNSIFIQTFRTSNAI